MAAESWGGLSPPYRTIVADPPWRYEQANPPNPQLNWDSERRGYKGARLPYSSLTLEEITALSVAEIADENARIFLWTTNRYLRHAWGVLEAWGFEPGGRLLVWCKQPRGTMNVTTEFILTGKRGRPPRLPWHNTTWFDWPLQVGRGHSAKPAAALDLIESWSAGPYVELFARTPRLGWDSWGLGYELDLRR